MAGSAPAVTGLYATMSDTTVLLGLTAVIGVAPAFVLDVIEAAAGAIVGAPAIVARPLKTRETAVPTNRHTDRFGVGGPSLMKLIMENRLEAYNMPQGALCRLPREIAGRRPGFITRVGLGTFVDPRIDFDSRAG